MEVEFVIFKVDDATSIENPTKDKAITTIPATILVVVSSSFGSYRCAVGMSSCKQMYVIMPATSPKTIPKVRGLSSMTK